MGCILLLNTSYKNHMKYALIGCGRISPNHIEAAIKNNLDIVAICDVIEGRMNDIISCFDLKKIKKYSDYKELLKKERPEIVAIATESGKHASIAIDCINSDCNVIIEKPIALSISDAEKIINAGKSKGVIVSVSHQNRFNKSIQYIRKAIDDGRFGRLSHGTAHIRWNREKDYYDQAKWRGTWGQDGGCLMNQCIHNIDLLRWMMGDGVDEVFAYTDRLFHPYIEAEDLGIAVIKFSNGSYGMIEGTTNVFQSNFEESLYIFGQKGTAKAAGKSVNTIEEWIFGDQIDVPEIVKEQFSDNPPNVYGYGHTPLYKDVIESIIKHRAPLVDAEAGKRALELVLAIYKSAYEKKPVKLPLKNCTTKDFIGRFKDI